jgi:hypothetical protein
MSLLIVECIKATELMKRASKISKSRYEDTFAHKRYKLWEFTRLRTTESDELLRIINKASEQIKELNEASSDKMNALIQLSRLVLPVSRDDSEAIFIDAMNIAKEMDLETFHQINFVSILAEQTQIQNQDHSRNIANEIFAFVSYVAKHLSGHKRFPWDSAIHALTCLDFSVALAAISCWMDEGRIILDGSIDQFIQTALEQKHISLETSTALAILNESLNCTMREELIARAMINIPTFIDVIDLLSKDILLFSPQDEKLALGEKIVDRVTQGDYHERSWLLKLRETISFLRSLADNTVNNNDAQQMQSVLQNRPNNYDLSEVKSFTTKESMIESIKKAQKEAKKKWAIFQCIQFY